jgi:ATP adenylyltransferase
MGELTKNIFNHLTAKEREYLSFPAKILLNQDLLKGEVLDFGCGFGKDVELLKEKGINIIGYDKHYFPEYPNKKFDTIICFYVLNVLMPEEQSAVLMEVARLLKPTGKAYFAVRRDLQYQGFRIHKVHKKPTYQCIVKLPFQSIFENEYCEIYEYRHYNQTAKKLKYTCPFCNLNPSVTLITESAMAYAIFDKYPVSKGHALVIPKRHIDNYFELSLKEQTACWLMLNYVQNIIAESFNPDGVNIGINVQEAAGQTVSHVHIHIIPRYTGDVEDPRGGVRGVIPKKKYY